jgi:tRNA pseudouridine38-40 synthase
MRNLRLTLEYDGSGFFGFQRQPNRRTVQGELEGVLCRLLDEPIKVIGAGRTDAGVHATGQVVNFNTSKSLPLEKAAEVFNMALPSDVVVRKAEEVDLGFNARRMARSRTYRYTALNTPMRSARLSRFVGWVAAPLALEPMNKAASLLLGEHDFAAFQASGSPTKTTFRRLMRAACKRLGNMVWIVLEADAFLYQMARIIVSSLFLVGMGERQVDWPASLLESRERRLAPSPAPAQGLCLVNVRY